MRPLSHTVAKSQLTMIENRKGGKAVKIVTLCSAGSCCPVVKITDDRTEIGEEGNLCVLTSEEWETLKSKILNKEM